MIDDEEYEKNETFFVVLGEPKVVKQEKETDDQPETYDPEKERIEELGKPKLSKLSHCFFVYSCEIFVCLFEEDLK